MKNILPKMIVSVAAVIFWLLIVAGQEYVTVREVSLKVYDPRSEVTLGKALPEHVNVRVEGPGHILYFQRWMKNASLVLDVGTIYQDQRISLKSYFEQRPNQVILHPEITFLEIVYPDSVDIVIENKVTREIPLEIASDISVRSGYIQVDESVQSHVTVTGPENHVNSLDHLRTETLKKENADMSFSAEISVINPDPELLNLDPGKVKVAFEIEMIGERSIHNIPVKVRNQPPDLELQLIPDAVSLRITGGNGRIQDLAPNDFLVHFDYLAQWFPNKHYYPVNIDPPEEVLDIISINPETIEVVVIKRNDE